MLRIIRNSKTDILKKIEIFEGDNLVARWLWNNDTQKLENGVGSKVSTDKMAKIKTELERIEADYAR